jgi:acetyltransferase
MARHYLTPLLTPDSIAVFGAIERQDSVGGRVFANLIESRFPDLIAINPKHDQVLGRACLKNINAASCPGVLAADRAVELGVSIATLSEASVAALNDCLPPHWSKANPVDVLGDAGHDRYESAIEICLNDKNVDSVLAMLTPQAMTDPSKIAESVIRAATNHPNKPVLACWMGSIHVNDAHRIFDEAGIPSYYTPENATAGFSYLASYQKSQRLLLEVLPPLAASQPSDIQKAREIIKTAQLAGRDQLNSVEAKNLLAAFQIPIIESHHVTDAEAAVRAADSIGYPVVIKISSKDLSHKSDVGGVELNLTNAEQVRSAFTAMIERVRTIAPQVDLDCVTVEKCGNRHMPGS